MNVICNYCGKEAALVSGEIILPNKPELHSVMYWHCEPCAAWTQCRKDGDTRSTGKLANKELRKARMLAHKSIDLMIDLKNISKTEAYKWISKQLGLSTKIAQISSFDLNECSLAISICMMEINNSPSRSPSKCQ